MFGKDIDGVHVILNCPSTQMGIPVTQMGAYKCTASNVYGILIISVKFYVNKFSFRS